MCSWIRVEQQAMRRIVPNHGGGQSDGLAGSPGNFKIYKHVSDVDLVAAQIMQLRPFYHEMDCFLGRFSISTRGTVAWWMDNFRFAP